MLRHWIKRRLKAFERRTGESTAYVEEMMRHTPAGFRRFALFLPLTAFHRALPKDAYHLARVATIRHEDCGPCLQTVVRMALEDGVPRDWLQAVLSGHGERLPQWAQVLLPFTEAVLDNSAQLPALQLNMAGHFDEAQLAELALVIASVRVFPTVKRAMGHALSCSLVKLELDHAA